MFQHAESVSIRLKNSTTDHANLLADLRRQTMRGLCAAAPETACSLAMRLFFTPSQAVLREEERIVLNDAERVTLHLRNERIEAYVWGQGPLVLLVHGWGGHAGQMTGFVKSLLRAGFRCVALDMPGHGCSAGRRSSLVHFAQAIAAAHDALGPFHGIVGHSLGAIASLRAIARAPTNRMALISAPSSVMDIFTQFAETTGLSDAVLRRMIARTETLLKTSMKSLEPLPLARRVSTPVLALHAPEDATVTYESGARLAAAFPNSRFKALPGLGHMRIVKNWRTIVEVTQFMRGLEMKPVSLLS